MDCKTGDRECGKHTFVTKQLDAAWAEAMLCQRPDVFNVLAILGIEECGNCSGTGLHKDGAPCYCCIQGEDHTPGHGWNVTHEMPWGNKLDEEKI